jgi:aryl-alcohol dehydrogenase-like predicted oxidoreductase
MNYKNFSKSSEKISQLGFGTWGIGKTFWIGAEDNESKRALHKAIELGINFFDSALVYGNGHSEKLIGEVEKESGKHLFITSKIPSKKFEWPANDKSKLEDSFPEKQILLSTERSLRNLNRDYLDLQQFHVWNDNWAEQDEWKEAVLKLKKDGKVKYFGISMNDHQAENGIKAAESGLIDSFQVIFNIFDQSPIDKLFPYCLENKISIIARVPLDEGGLTGNITKNTEFPKGDWRNNYFRGDRKTQIEEKVSQIQNNIGSECDSIAECALRFIISFDAVTTVIPGMRSTSRVIENANIINKGILSAELLEKLKLHRWDRNFYK